MRFASFVTVVAVIAGAPMIASATGEPMQSDRFISAVRCAAYDSLPQFARESGDVGLVRMQLNAEARRQSPATEAAAERAVGDVVAEANARDAAALRQARASACSGAGAMVARRPAPGDEA